MFTTTFYFFLNLSVKMKSFYQMFPQQVNCVSITSMFKSNSKEYYLSAAHDWPDTAKGEGIGHFQCFCEKQFSFINFFIYNDHAKLCDKYDRLYLYNTITEMTFTYGITISDLVFQHVNLYIVKLIGFKLISEEKRELMTSTFIL